MASKQPPRFNLKIFLTQVGSGKTTLQCRKNQIVFSQGDAADAVFFIQEGQVKLAVVSPQGKEAVVAILDRGHFFGEGCLVAGQLVCMATASSLGNSTLVRIDKHAMIDVLRNEPAFSELFLTPSLESQYSHPRGLGGSTL